MNDLGTITRIPKEFSKSLNKLKHMFCDVEIVVEMIRIPAHKIVLASSSAYFEEIFRDNESMGDTELENIDLKTFQSLLEYCYTGDITVTKKNVKNIMMSAGFLKINAIIEGCEQILMKKLDPLNSILIWKFAKTGNFRNIAFEYAKQNFEKVSQLPEFLDLNDSEISELLNSDIIVANETIVFDSVKKWLSHDNTWRKQHVDKLLKYVRFDYLPGNILSGPQLFSFCSVHSSTECLNKILNALRWKDENEIMPFDENIRGSYKTLMVVGSKHFNDSISMEIFYLRNEKWIKVKNFDCKRVTYSAVLLEHKLILIGGQRKYTVINTVQSYNLETGVMENMPAMIYPRKRLSAVEFKGRIYAIGGFNQTHLAYVEMWDPVSQEWKELTPMLTPRSACEARVLNEEIFVVGGGNEKDFLSDIESYNPVTDKWKKCAPMNEKRFAPGVTVIGDYLYVAGGMSSNDVFLNTAEKYDYKIDKWTTIHSLQNINAWMGSGNLFGKFVIIGGSSKFKNNWSSMEMYDNENDNWIFMPSLNEPQRMLQAIEIPWPLARTVLSRENLK